MAPTLEQASDASLRRHLVETRHGHMHVLVAGEGEATPFVFLHPSLCSGSVYEPFVARLGSDRTVVMPDRLGFGDSDRLDEQLPLEKYACATLDALDALGIDTFDGLGIHSGSCELIELATAHADRVRRAALITIPYFTAEEVAHFKGRYISHPEPAEDGSHLGWYWRWWREGGFDGSAPRTVDYPPELTHRWVRWHLMALPHFWWAYHAVIGYPTGERLGQITQPLLLFRTPDDLEEQTEAAIPLLPEQATVTDAPGFSDVLQYYAWDPDDAAEIAGHLRRFLA